MSFNIACAKSWVSYLATDDRSDLLIGLSDCRVYRGYLQLASAIRFARLSVFAVRRHSTNTYCVISILNIFNMACDESGVSNLLDDDFELFIELRGHMSRLVLTGVYR